MSAPASEYKIARPPRLHELVARRMQDLVFSGEWKLGSQLTTERELCAQFGVSRTVVREALKSLVARGLLTDAGSGLIVSDNVSEPLKSFVDLFLARKSSSGSKHLFEVRSLLEVEIAGLAAERATEQDMLELGRTNDALKKLHQKSGPWSEKDTAEFERIDLQFHLAVAESTRNELFVLLLSALSDALLTAWARISQRAEVRERGIQMHDKMFSAIRQRDPQGARRATRENLDRFLADVARVDESTDVVHS